MGSKEQEEEERDNKPSPVLTSGQQSHNFVTVSDERNIKCFRWEILNFSNVNDESIFTNYFPIGDFSFRFQLFPKGEASRDTLTKYLGLFQEMDNITDDSKSIFLCSEVVMVNHVDVSKSMRKYIYHRYQYCSNSNGQKDFVSLDFLQGPQSEFLLNGSDLHIDFEVCILEDNLVYVAIPQDEQGDVASASTSTDFGTENDGVYEGKFKWDISNYSLFAERFKNNGEFRSRNITIGQATYSVHLECQRTHREGDDKCLSLFLNREDVSTDNNPFCVLAFGLWNWKAGKVDNLSRVYGRLGVKNVSGVAYLVRWVKVMDMSEFENPDNGHILDSDKVRLCVHFYALREYAVSRFTITNAESKWFIGTGTDVSSSEHKDAEIISTTFMWEIKNLSWMLKIARLFRMKHAMIRSRRIKFGEYETNMVFFPLGMSLHPLHAVLCIENLNGGNFLDDERSFLVYCRIGVQDQREPDRSTFQGSLLRFDSSVKFCGLHDFLIRVSDFYSDSGPRLIVDGRVVLVTKLRVVEEKFLEEEIFPPLVGDRQRKRITWELENFLAWKELQGRRILSRFFTIGGCKLRIVIRVAANDGTVTAAVYPDPAREEAGDRCTVICRFAVMNLNEIPQWHQSLNIQNVKGHVVLGNIPDFVKQGYTRKDKIVLSCEIDACLLLKHESTDEDE